GINIGGLGFLTAVSSAQLAQALAAVWSGQFVVEPRSLIEACGQTQGTNLHQIALNDFVVSRGTVPRLIELEVAVDDAVLTRYRCDGRSVRSRTGAPAYSLAPGGPIPTPQPAVLTDH